MSFLMNQEGQERPKKVTVTQLRLSVEELYNSIPSSDLRMGKGNDIFTGILELSNRPDLKDLFGHIEPTEDSPFDYTILNYLSPNKNYSDQINDFAADVTDAILSFVIDFYEKDIQKEHLKTNVEAETDKITNAISKLSNLKIHFPERLINELKDVESRIKDFIHQESKRIDAKFGKPAELTNVVAGVTRKYYPSATNKVFAEIINKTFPDLYISENTVFSQLNPPNRNPKK